MSRLFLRTLSAARRPATAALVGGALIYAIGTPFASYIPGLHKS
jgi:hypothetical protein